MSVAKKKKGDCHKNFEINPKRRKNQYNIMSNNLNTSSQDIFEETSSKNETEASCSSKNELGMNFTSSQCFNDSLIMNQIESTIESVNKNTKYTSDHKKEALSRTLSELLNHSDIDVIFDEIEDSIYQMGSSQPDKSILHESVLEIICKNDTSIENIEDELKKGDKSFLNMSSFNLSFGSAFKNKLLQNASKTSVQREEILSAAVIERPLFQKLGPFYGLPIRVKELIKFHRGIDDVYDWQDECLNLPPVHEKRNLIYALPTSGGKTLVAEIIILREILCYKKNALFILPFVAIVQEKVWALSPFAVALDFLVEEYAGSKGTYPPRKRRRKNSVFVATIEKALGLINSLIETGRLDEFGLIVVDELHLIGETKRGGTLEALLTKLSLIQDKIQVIGMSATIGNLNDICCFLKAEAYTKNFRPIELKEFVKCGDELAKIDSKADDDDILTVERKIDFNYAPAVRTLDPDQLGGLVMEVIPKGSCLIFCATKRNCENVAKLLSKILFKSLKEHKANDKEVLIKSLNSETGTICSILKYSIPFGIAYHHSGLTTEERRLIEEGFREGVISVICCTSTLAAGVNLPAQRVILRSPYVGREFINLSRYKQMVGRAGRTGLQEKGDSILVCTSQDLPKVIKMLKSPMDKALSTLHENEGNGLRNLLLSCIALGIANTRNELQKVTRKTLLAVQNKNERELKNSTDKIIKDLLILGAIETTNLEIKQNSNVSINLETTISENDSSQSQSSQVSKKQYRVKTNSRLVVSKLGLAAIKGGFDLSKAQILYEDLIQAQHSLVLLDPLHLLYLVTPYDLSEQVKPDMSLYFTKYQQLNEKELCTARILGIDENVAVKMISNKRITNVSERVLNRFYLTLILYDLWNEMPIFDTAIKYEVERGLVQNLMQASATFASSVVNFCQELEEFWPFVHLLKGMSIRLSYCCSKELLPLMELPAVKQTRAKQLYNAGYKTLHSIAKANVDDLVKDIEYMSRQVAYQLVASAKMLLLEKVENLREEAEDVLNGVDNPIEHSKFQ